jgi:segregation and condensation protein A
MPPSEEYRVKLDVFEGPLDLLLYLIRREEVDIYDIPIERITQQYMSYLDLMRMLDLNIAGEFIVMAATLMMIKSRMLLPVDERPGEEEEDDEGDPRWDLVRQLVEYKKFKDAALHLQDLEEQQENIFMRSGDGVELGKQPDVSLQDVSIFDLIAAFNEALSKVQKEELREIFAERYTVGEKIDDLLEKIKTRERLSLTALFADMTSRHEVVCTFLAVLELIRLKQIRATQSEAYGPIELIRATEE